MPAGPRLGRSAVSRVLVAAGCGVLAGLVGALVVRWQWALMVG